MMIYFVGNERCRLTRGRARPEHIRQALKRALRIDVCIQRNASILIENYIIINHYCGSESESICDRHII